MLLKIKGKDYTTKIVEGSYDVNSEDVYTSWTDANYVQHRQIFRTKIKGSFEMYFKDQKTYETFLEDLESAKTLSGYYNLGIMVNNTNVYHDLKSFYVEFTPTRRQKVLGQAYFPSVSVKLEER